MPKIIATKEDWIKLGYRQFSDKGISGIVIESMAKKLKVNKSSFYWHFSTKKAFIQSIINFWEIESTSKIISLVRNNVNPRSRFEKLIELSFLKDNEMDFFFYLKKYARSNKSIADKIEELDKQRIDFTADTLCQLGYPKSEARVKSNIFYKYLIGYHEMIRYKKQNSNYVTQVKSELSHFIKF
ncbi:TetR/AcrR family transcriptional regulator [Maribacter chungangensis]|uniref:TetR/AcrR family transcriptional regulator n=1 Tax=Maribacter chungangensis TaxID=1069117 RepID=A0ABW3B547_9FLAO